MASTEQVQIFECPTCDKIYCSKNGLYKHKKLHHDDPAINPSVNKTLCGQTLLRFHTLNEKKVDTTVKPSVPRDIQTHQDLPEKSLVSCNIQNNQELFESITPTQADTTDNGTPWSDIIHDVSTPFAGLLTPEMNKTCVSGRNSSRGNKCHEDHFPYRSP